MRPMPSRAEKFDVANDSAGPSEPLGTASSNGENSVHRGAPPDSAIFELYDSATNLHETLNPPQTTPKW